MKTWMYALGICIAADGSVGGGPIPDPGASRDTPRPPYDIASFRQDAPEASGPQLAAWRRPTFCESTLFSRSSVWGMAAFRDTFQQAVLPLLAGLGQIVLRRATRETGLRRRVLSRYADHLGSGRVKGWMARSTFLPILLLAISKSYCVCRFCQSCALVPKYRDNRSAISAVIARRRRTISLTVGAATPSSFATL